MLRSSSDYTYYNNNVLDLTRFSTYQYVQMIQVPIS